MGGGGGGEGGLWVGGRRQGTTVGEGSNASRGNGKGGRERRGGGGGDARPPHPQDHPFDVVLVPLEAALHRLVRHLQRTTMRSRQGLLWTNLSIVRFMMVMASDSAASYLPAAEVVVGGAARPFAVLSWGQRQRQISSAAAAPH